MPDDDDKFASKGEIGSYRRDGPATMKEGAVAIAPELKTLRARVYRVFETFGPMTDREFVLTYREAYGSGEYRSLITRRRELVDRILIRDTGITKLNPITNVPNIVWAIIPEQLRQHYTEQALGRLTKAKLLKENSEFRRRIDDLLDLLREVYGRWKKCEETRSKKI